MPKSYRRFIKINGRLTASPSFRTKADAELWYQEVKRQKQFGKFGIAVTGSGERFIDFARRWLKHRMKEYPKATWLSDEQRLRCHVLPHLADRKINEITRDDIKSVLKLVTDRGLSRQTRTRVQALLSSLFKAALNETPPLIKENPAREIVFDEKRKVKTKKPSFIAKPEDLERVLCVAQKKSDLHAVMVAILLMTGLRKSELIALRWRHVSGDMISIEEKFEQASGKILNATKDGEDSFSVVPIPQSLREILLSYRQRSKFSGPDDFILAGPSGKPIGPRTMSTLFAEVAVEANLKVSIHGLRHTYGVHFVLRNGNTKALQAILRHKQSSTTDLYSKLSGEMVRQFSEVMSIKSDTAETQQDLTKAHKRREIRGKKESRSRT